MIHQWIDDFYIDHPLLSESFFEMKCPEIDNLPKEGKDAFFFWRVLGVQKGKFKKSLKHPVFSIILVSG